MQLGLSLPSSPSAALQSSTPGNAASDAHDEDRTAADLDLEAFDDYDEQAAIEGVPRLRLVDPPAPMPRVIVEVIGEDIYEVSRLRDNGTTVACVRWTKDELTELIGRVRAALEVSR